LYRVVDLDPEIRQNSWNPPGLRSRSRKELGVFDLLELELLEKKTRSWSGLKKIGSRSRLGKKSGIGADNFLLIH